MIQGTDMRWLTVVAPQTVATNATASARIDLVDLGTPGDLAIVATMPAASATNASAKWTVLAIAAADTTTFSTSNTISGLVGTTNTTAAAGQFVLPGNNNTALGQKIILTVRNPGRFGRYFFIQYQGAASNNTVQIDAIGGHPRELPSPSSEAVASNGAVVSI
jgi:hypothetical protein